MCILSPTDAGWDGARGTFNLLIDQQPRAIALPSDAREVAASISYARRHGLRVAPQSTGHNAGPLGSLEDTLIVNTSGLTGVSIDAAARRVRAGTATRWRDVVPALSDLGLAALHGSSPDVGIAGYSLGGGIGWLARKHGMQANAVTAIELVTAEGQLVRTDAAHEPELFWALRGGGGNFGVVTALEFEVLPVRSVYAGALFFPLERAAEVLHTWTGAAAGSPGGDDHVGEHHPLPARSGAAGAAARELVRGSQGGVPGLGARGALAVAAAARAGSRHRHAGDAGAGRAQ